MSRLQRAVAKAEREGLLAWTGREIAGRPTTAHETTPPPSHVSQPDESNWQPDATPAHERTGSVGALSPLFVAATHPTSAAAEQYRLALTYHEMGMPDDAIKALEQAARSPRQRFDAASMLGRLYLERKDPNHAIEWLERAAEAPAPTPDAGRALLYDLGKILEAVGEHSRALAVFVELESESGGYRDVAGKIEKLSKAQARG